MNVENRMNAAMGPLFSFVAGVTEASPTQPRSKRVADDERNRERMRSERHGAREGIRERSLYIGQDQTVRP